MNFLKKFLAITLIFVMQFQSVHASVAIGGGWGLNLIRVENSTSIFTAFKDGFQSTVAISPSSAQVAKSLLRGGLVGVAMVAVTQVLEDGVDYLLDSANQDLKYRVKPKNNPTYLNPYGWDYNYETGFYPTADLACKSTLELYKTRYPNTGSLITKLETQFYPKGTCATCYMYDATNKLITLYTVGFNKNPNYNPKLTSGLTEKRIPLLQLATKIIASAEQGNPEAKAYIASVVQDMLLHDEDYRTSLEAQLEAKLKEAQSIGSNNGNNNNGGNSNSGNNSATKPVPSTSGNSTTANPTPPTPPNEEEDANQKINNVLKDAKFLKKSSTKQFEKSGGFAQAKKDFDSLGLQNVRSSLIRGKPAWMGQFRNGVKVVAREYSSEGSPTLEIQLNTKIEIRYK